MASRQQSIARRCSYLLEPKNWLVVTLLGLGWRFDPAARAAGLCWGALAAVFAAAIPMVFIGHGVRNGRFADRYVGARGPRLLVLAVILASIGMGLALLVLLGAPRQLAGYLVFMLCSVALLALLTTVWKVSIHCAVSAGSVVVLARAFGPALLALFALVALVGWSRVALRDHTVVQAVAGTVLGGATAAVAYTVSGAFTGL
ncbi:MAG TPA: phosphatase PAP2 family protein [Streptosporangiaceae bacterium]|nr:phosphatase PAP2 family protein [Streptosporangiaceae bacterium]